MQFKVTKLTTLLILGSLLVPMFTMEKEGCSLPASIQTAQADNSTQNVIFRLLAVENRLGNRTANSAENFLKCLTLFSNWQNQSSSSGFQYTSYVRLLSEVEPSEIDEECQRFYIGRPTKANFMKQVIDFLFAPRPKDVLTVQILYYSGNAEKVVAEDGMNFCLALDERVYDWELDWTLRTVEEDDAACTLLILDSHYSGGFMAKLAQPSRVLLTACDPFETAKASTVSETSYIGWFTGTESATYPNGTGFGPLGLVGGIKTVEDSNHDGWRSANEIFQFAARTTRCYAANQTSPEYGTNCGQNPWAHFGIAGGEIPIVQTDSTTKFPHWGKLLPTQLVSPDPHRYGSQDFQHPMYRYSPSHLGFSRVNGPEAPDLLWARYLSDPISSSVAVADGMVFVGTNGGTFCALDMTSGAVIWTVSTGSPIYSSPAVENGIVVFGSAEPGRVYAFDQYRGTVRWMYDVPSGKSVLSSPTIKDGKVFITSSDGYLRVFALFEGSLVQELYVGGDVRSSPAVSEGRIFVMGNSVKAFDEVSGILLWRFDTSWPIFFSSAAVSNGVVYLGTGNDDSVYALNATTGTALWQFKTGGWFSSPSIDSERNRVILACRDARVYCLNKNNGLLVWEYVTEDSNHMSSPTISVNGLVYFGSLDNRLYCLNEQTGAQVWHYKTGGIITSAPVVISEHLLAGSADGYLYCFGPPFPHHDVAVLNGTLSKRTCIPGDLLEISCTVKNLGNTPETLTIGFAYNVSEVWQDPGYSEPERLRSETIAVEPGEAVVFSCVWNTSGMQTGEYGVIVQADLTTDETQVANNAVSAGILLLWPQTDLNSDGVVDIVDIATVARSIGTRPGDEKWSQIADLDTNDIINIVDVAMVARDFGKTF